MSALTALLIAPDRELAAQISAACERSSAIDVMADLKSYPSEQTLEMRLRQLDPDVVLLDTSSSAEKALALIAHLTKVSFGVSVAAVDKRSDPDLVVRALRAGASEFLHAPFDEQTMNEALARLLRLRRPDPVNEGELGTVLAFSSVKPGSGASTVALQTAFALERTTHQRVLLIDLDLTGGTVGFYLKLDMQASVADAVAQADRLCPSIWRSLVTTSDGVDVLPSPALPADEPIDPGRVQTVLDYARTIYDWIVVDLPVAIERTSLITMAQTDRVFLISTSELPSLHLARRAVRTFEQLGFPKERCEVVVNRIPAGSKLKIAEIGKLLHCEVRGALPNDYFSLHRVVTLGQALPGDEALGAAIGQLAGRTVESAAALKRIPEGVIEAAIPAGSFSN